MGGDELNGHAPVPEHLSQWRKRHPILFVFSWVFVWFATRARNVLSVIFAPWPSMHDPMKRLLNVTDAEEADKLTEKWVKGKLEELQYVGLSSALVTGTIASAFSWYTLQDDPWSAEACWYSALVLALTAISLATQQTIGLSRLCSCENGWHKVRCLLGEVDPRYQKTHLEQSYLRRPRTSLGSRVRMRKSQLWMWQTPVMLSNFAILLFVIGLMISVFVRAARSQMDWTKGDMQIAIFFGCAAIFAGSNYLFCWICLNRGSLDSTTNITDFKIAEDSDAVA